MGFLKSTEQKATAQGRPLTYNGHRAVLVRVRPGPSPELLELEVAVPVLAIRRTLLVELAQWLP